MNHTAVSVIIPAYNEARRIGNCLRSLKRQTWPSVEIIVVDDGSTDGTGQIALNCGCQVHRRQHSGPGAARNFGARVAHGDILAFLDADMTFAEGYLEALIEPILKGTEVSSTTWDEYVENWGNCWARCENAYSNLPPRRRLPLEIPERHSVYRAVRRDFFLTQGGFAEGKGRSDDKSLCERTGVTAVIVKGAVCFHRNADTLRQVFRDAAWAGRDVLAREASTLRRLRAPLAENLASAVMKGMVRAVTRKEPLLPCYSLVRWAGFNWGVLDAWLSKRYTK